MCRCIRPLFKKFYQKQNGNRCFPLHHDFFVASRLPASIDGRFLCLDFYLEVFLGTFPSRLSLIKTVTSWMIDSLSD